MSAGVEHNEYREALGAYALDALSDEECQRIRNHLASCHQCRAELEWLSASVDALPASVTPIEPPPELKARVMQVVEAEAELLRAAGERADRPAPEPRRRGRWRAQALPGSLALGCAAAVAVALVLLTSGGSGARTIRAQVTDPALARHVRASVVVRDGRAELVVSGLPAPPAGHIDELWVKRGGAPPQRAGVFVVRSGSVQVSRPVHRGDLVLMTVEPGRGTAKPTSAPLLVAKV